MNEETKKQILRELEESVNGSTCSSNQAIESEIGRLMRGKSEQASAVVGVDTGLHGLDRGSMVGRPRSKTY